MTKQEFLNNLPEGTREPTAEEYRNIEFVYTYHPAINEVGGKKQIAQIWALGGNRLIIDMRKTAEKAQLLEDKIRDAKNAYDKALQEYADLKNGEEVQD